MKTLYLVRHAKSSWDDSGLSDFDRPLNNRGERDAPLMADRLKQKGILPQLFISSAAKRAASTSKRFAKAMGYNEERIDFQKKLYHASAGEVIQLLRNRSDKIQSVIVFGHNPGLTELANQLAESGFVTDNIPTCGITAFSFDIESWKDVAAGKGRLLFFDYPKNTRS